MRWNYTIQHYTVLNRFARLCATLSTDRQQQLESTALHAHYKLPQSYNYCRALPPRTKDTAHLALCSLRCSVPPSPVLWRLERTSRPPLMQHTCTQRRSLLSTPTYYTHHVTHCRRNENRSTLHNLPRRHALSPALPTHSLLASLQ